MTAPPPPPAPVQNYFGGGMMQPQSFNPQVVMSSSGKPMPVQPPQPEL